MNTATRDDLVSALLAGEHRALARVITKIENRSPGYRDLIARLHAHTGSAEIIGITGSPGAGKSTLVDKLAAEYRDRGETVGVIAVDPSSPYSGGAVLGDRIRMASTVGDMDVFVRSMSARGQLGGLSSATTDAVRALDAFGKDKIIIETVGAGQNEVDIVETADTVVVLVQPSSGDDVQMLKAGILEIGDIFVVNKADLDGATKTVANLEEMLHLREDHPDSVDVGHHGVDAADVDTTPANSADAGIRDDVSGATTRDGASDAGSRDGASDAEPPTWDPVIVETVATDGTGIDDLMEALSAHREYLANSGRLSEMARRRYAREIQTLVRADIARLVDREIETRGGIDALADRVLDRETDPYSVAAELVDPVEECLEESLEDDVN